MDAQIKTLFKSDIIEVRSFICQCNECGWSGIEYQEKLSICYVDKGSFLFSIFNNDLECFNGKFLINKPGFTHKVKHYHIQPDQCFIISFDQKFYSQVKESYRNSLGSFFKNPDVHSLVINSTAETEYLVYQLGLLFRAHFSFKLQVESIVLDLMDILLKQNLPVKNKNIPYSHKRAYLPLVEKTKAFMQEHFSDNLTIGDLAAVACMSPFHFNRVFKQIAQISPYQYLLNFRVSHAAYLLNTTNQPIATVSYLSGFNSPDHFSYTFKIKKNTSPELFRKQ